ncbi:MAG: hypothetical protein ACF8PN_05835 [Phycisphaerales bacterium]
MSPRAPELEQLDDAFERAVLECPRCGYDQRGSIRAQIERAEDGAWPLGGRCAECGLDYETRELLDETEHPWLFERHWRRRPVRSAIKTLAMTLRPWRFWREVEMRHEGAIGPVLALAPFVFVVAFLCYVIFIAADLASIRPPPLAVDLFRDFGVILYDLITDLMVSLEVAIRLAIVLSLFVGWVVFQAAAFAACPISLRRAKARASHIIRIAAYGLLSIALFWSGYILARTVITLVFAMAGTEIRLYGAADWLMWLGPPVIWAAVWWGFACSRYLRLPRPWLVAITLTGVADLAAFTLVLWLWLTLI